jgi:hypothetical protein
LGIALGEVPDGNTHVSGIDLDHVFDGGDVDPRAMEILAEGDCYAELSPSGEGLHILGTGDVGHADVKSGAVGLEIYSGARYFTVTGDVFKRGPLSDLSETASLARTLFHGEEPSRSRVPHPERKPLRGLSRVVWTQERSKVVAMLPYLDPEEYDVWLRVGMAIHKACAGNESGFDLWHRWSAGQLTVQPPDNYKGISDCRHRWRSFGRRRGRLVTLGTLVAMARARGFACR